MNRSTHTDLSDPPLDPKVAAELDALDAALRGDAIDDDALAALVRDVKAQAPVMPSELRVQLRDDVAAGFPRGGAAGAFQKVLGGKATAPGARKRRSFAFGGGMAVTAVLAVFVVGVALTQDSNKSLTLSGDDAEVSNLSAPGPLPASVSEESETSTTSTGGATGSTVERTRGDGMPNSASASDAAPGAKDAASAALAAGATAATDTVAPPSSADFESRTSTPASGKRRVEQAVDLLVRVKSGKLDEAAGKVNDITRGAGGFVADSRVSVGTRGAGSATFTLQVASSKLDQAIDRLSDLGTVTSQNQSTVDITSSFDSANQRLSDAKAVRKALLRSLAKADSAGEIASLRARIADNRGTIAGLESDLLKLNKRTNLTTISLSLTAPSGDAPDSEDDGQWSIGDAAGDALKILGAVSGVLLVGAAALLPFAILIAIGWVIYRVRRKRQRDAALDD